jgi:hypothetical protein
MLDELLIFDGTKLRYRASKIREMSMNCIMA